MSDLTIGPGDLDPRALAGVAMQSVQVMAAKLLPLDNRPRVVRVEMGRLLFDAVRVEFGVRRRPGTPTWSLTDRLFGVDLLVRDDTHPCLYRAIECGGLPVDQAFVHCPPSCCNGVGVCCRCVDWRVGD